MKLNHLSTPHQFVSVSDWDFNPDKIRGDIASLLSSLGKSGSAKSRDAMSLLNVHEIAERLTSAALEDKIHPPTTKILNVPTRLSDLKADLMTMQEREAQHMKEILTIPEVSSSNRIAPAPHGSSKQPQGKTKGMAGVGVGVNAPPLWKDKKLVMIESLGGLPQSTLLLQSANATDYRTHSWEAAACHIDQGGALWISEVASETCDSHVSMGVRPWEGASQILCRLHDLQSVVTCQLDDQPSFLYCFRLELQSSHLIFAALSEESRWATVQTACDLWLVP